MKNITKFFLALTVVCALCPSCNQESLKSIPQVFEENPATISWDFSKSENIETFSADVFVYADSNRRSGGAKLQSRYKMAVKIAEDKQYVRIDYPASENMAAKSLLTNGIDSILVNTSTNTIEQKFTASESELKLINDLSFITSQQTLSKINLSKIKKEVSKLSLDMTEDKKEKVLTVQLPSRYFTTDKEKRLSTKISYDTANELMENVETITEKDDGSIVTVTTCPVYEEIENGQIVKIGQYSVIDTKSQVRYEGLEELEYFDSLDNIPEISNEEYENLLEEGNAAEIEDFSLGDPSDPSSVETLIELYDNIEINLVDDTAFKLIMEM